MHACVLLKADRGLGGPSRVDMAIADAVEVSQPTIARVRRWFVEARCEAALNRRAPRREYRRTLGGEHEPHLIALTCSTPPEGQDR